MITRYLAVCNHPEIEKQIVSKWLNWIRQDHELYLCSPVPDLSDPYLKVAAKKFIRTKSSYEFKENSPVWLDEFDFICVDNPESFSAFTGTNNVISLQQLLELMQS